MKWLVKGIVIGVLAIFFLSFCPQKIKPAGSDYYCWVFFDMENKDRYCYGYVNTECSWPHSVPFGNWGVDSNVGTRWDDHQFQGWYPTADKWMEWNSCYKDFPPPDISCNYFYNANYQPGQGCTEQETSGAWDPYKVWKEVNTYAAQRVRKILIPFWQQDKG